jgi:hypothetical protein
MSELSEITQADLDKKITDLVQRAESHLDHVGNSSKSDCLVYELLNQLKATNNALVFITGCHREWSDLAINQKCRISEFEAENSRLTALIKQPMSDQDARFAIDEAIGRGKEGTHKPPTPDHWLMPYWEIGQQLAGKLPSFDINAIIRDICELPDRSSPEDDPDAMVVTADELKAVLLSNSLPFQPLNIDHISDKTILKIVGAFWRRAVPKEIPLPESIVSITAMRTSLMWIDMDRDEAVEFAKNQPVVFAVDSKGGHCD